MVQIDAAVVRRIIDDIDQLLGMRRGFNEAYRDWREEIAEDMTKAIGAERVDALENLGPRQAPINRQHRVHIYRQRLHAQRKYLVDLIEAAE